METETQQIQVIQWPVDPMPLGRKLGCFQKPGRLGSYEAYPYYGESEYMAGLDVTQTLLVIVPRALVDHERHCIYREWAWQREGTDKERTIWLMNQIRTEHYGWQPKKEEANKTALQVSHYLSMVGLAQPAFTEQQQQDILSLLKIPRVYMSAGEVCCLRDRVIAGEHIYADWHFGSKSGQRTWFLSERGNARIIGQ